MSTYRLKAAYDWSPDSVWLIGTPSSVAKSTFFYVQEVGRFKTGPKYFTERENLNSYLIVFTIAGKGYLHYMGRDYTLLPKQAFFIDCMEYQYYRTDATDLWEIAWVHFNGATSSGYYQQFAKRGSPVVSLAYGTPVPTIINQLIDIHQRKDVRTEPISSKLLVELLTHMLLAANDNDSSEFFIPDQIRKIMTYLDEHYDQRLSLNNLAKTHSISKYHLVREFKKYTGFTPYQYLINTRITRAKQLLTNTDLPVAEIASKVGIDNVSHFINLFKKREDITPHSFRKKWQRRL